MNPLPKELAHIARDLINKDVWVAVYSLDRELGIALPWLVVKEVKNLVLREAKSEQDVKDVMSFLVYDVVNTYFRLLFPSIPSIEMKDPDYIEVKKARAELDGREVAVVRIKATGFSVYPLEASTKAITIEADLYDLHDETDVFNYSRITVRINLKQLINELQIRWDLARG